MSLQTEEIRSSDKSAAVFCCRCRQSSRIRSSAPKSQALPWARASSPGHWRTCAGSHGTSRFWWPVARRKGGSGPRRKDNCRFFLSWVLLSTCWLNIRGGFVVPPVFGLAAPVCDGHDVNEIAREGIDD